MLFKDLLNDVIIEFQCNCKDYVEEENSPCDLKHVAEMALDDTINYYLQLKEEDEDSYIDFFCFLCSELIASNGNCFNKEMYQKILECGKNAIDKVDFIDKLEDDEPYLIELLKRIVNIYTNVINYYKYEGLEDSLKDLDKYNILKMLHPSLTNEVNYYANYKYNKKRIDLFLNHKFSNVLEFYCFFRIFLSASYNKDLIIGVVFEYLEYLVDFDISGNLVNFDLYSDIIIFLFKNYYIYCRNLGIETADTDILDFMYEVQSRDDLVSWSIGSHVTKELLDKMTNLKEFYNEGLLTEQERGFLKKLDKKE